MDVARAKPVTMSEVCQGCRSGAPLPIDITMAFQPIVDIGTGRVFGYEALVRGIDGRSAGDVLSGVSPDMIYKFDQTCRVTAIELAGRLFSPDDGARLSINFMPNAVYEPRACIRLTLATAMKTGFPLDRIIFEFTENEELDTKHILHILRTYRDMGFKTAIDDFGSGHSGLGLLSHFQPDIVKLDMDMIRGIDTDPVRRTIVKHTLRMLEELNIVPLCEGVETVGEMSALRDLGVSLIQGYLLAKPSFEHLAIPASAKAMLAAAA